MTKLHNRLLITLALAAVSVCVLGVGTVWAKPHTRFSSAVASVSTKPRSPIGPYSGEPDVGGQSAPKPSPNSARPIDPIVAASTPGSVGTWILRFWAAWMARH